LNTADPRLLNYIHWQNERGFDWPPKYSVKTSVSKPKILFLQDPSETSAAADALLAKMTVAMKLTDSDYQVVDANSCNPESLKQAKAGFLVILGRAAKDRFFPAANLGEWVQCDALANIPALCTYHPQKLVETPDLKRGAWQHCQIVMGRLSHA
jgi:hypothetical protein